MFLTFVLRALEHRKQRLLLALAALSVAATLATVLFAIYGTVERRIRDEFRGYGANIVVTPGTGTTLSLALAETAEKLGAEAAPWLITSGSIDKEAVAVAGFFPAKSASMTGYWHVQGTRDIGPADCLVGELLAIQFSLKPGSHVQLENAPCTVKGIISTGGAEDREILVPFEVAARLSGLIDTASVIALRAPGETIDSTSLALAKAFPDADVRTVRAVADTESAVVIRIRAALLLLTLLILGITTLCVTSNFSEAVMERAKEVGIMKALGAAESRIAALFVTESAALALLAALIGYGLGVFAAAAIGRSIFGVFHPEANWLVFSGVVGVMLLVSTLATGIAASRIWAIQPARILRGE